MRNIAQPAQPVRMVGSGKLRTQCVYCRCYSYSGIISTLQYYNYPTNVRIFFGPNLSLSTCMVSRQIYKRQNKKVLSTILYYSIYIAIPEVQHLTHNIKQA